MKGRKPAPRKKSAARKAGAPALRRRAERTLAERRKRAPPRAPAADLQRVVQELQIHQVELELQNEELLRARTELETLLRQYTDLYDFAPVGYLTLSREGAILQGNLAGAALLEVERSRLAGRRFADFVSFDSWPAVAGFLLKACDSSAKETSEAALYTSGNRPLHVQMEAVASGDGRGCRVALVDATERKRAEAALEASEARYRLLFESSKDGIVLFDAGTGEVIEANPSFCQLLGRPADAFPGKALWEIDALRAVADSRQALLERQSRGSLHYEHLPIETEDGRHLDVELVSHTYRVARGNVMHLSLRDIGERLRAERALRRMQEQRQLAQKLEAVGRLAGGVAHELNNKLGVVIGCADLLRRKLPADGPEHRKLHLIEEAARHSAGLTRQLLAFARKQLLQPRLMSPSALVADTAPLLSQLLGERVTVTLNLGATGLVRFDPGQLEGVVMSLAANARDAMPQGGSLSVETADVDLSAQETERPPVLPPAVYVTLTVRDTGSGLDATAMSRIFEPFFTTKDYGEGTGLGLAAVYGTVKQSDAYLFVESEPGRGATFRIYMPRAGAAAGAGELDGEAPALAPGVHTVMVVEGDGAASAWIAEALRAAGYVVLTAVDGEEAAALASHGKGNIDLLLADVVVSTLGGRAVADWMVARWPQMRVLYMSSYPKEDLSDRGLLEPGAGLLQKPFTPSELLQRVKGLDRPGPPAA